MESESQERLFRLEAIVGLATTACDFSENGRRRAVAAGCDGIVHLFHLSPHSPSASAPFPWDTPLVNMCWDPSGSWVLILGRNTVHVVPALAFLQPNAVLDRRWSLERPSLLPIELPQHSTAIVWWQTELSHPVAIVGDQTGGLTFFSLQTYKVIRKSFIVGKVCKLSIYINDDDDSVILLITSNRGRQWSLILETRVGKGKLLEKKKGSKIKDANKKFDDFLTTLKELGTDKMNSLFQMRSHSTSNVPDKFASHSSNKNPTPISLSSSHSEPGKSAENPYMRPTETRLTVSPQSSDGHHFVSVFNPNSGSFTLHRSIEDPIPVYTYRFKNLPPEVSKIVWEQKLIFVFGKNSIEIHSNVFSSQEEDMAHSLLWSEFYDEGEEFIDAWTICESSTASISPIKWTDSTDINDLQLPEFNLSSCLVITTKKIYILSTSYEVLKWLVERLVNGGEDTERIAAALKISLKPLLVAAADTLLAKKRFTQAMRMFRQAKQTPDDILNRLGALGYHGEMLLGAINPQSTKSSDMLLLVHVLHSIIDKQYVSLLLSYLEKNNQFTVMLCLRILIDLGLWDAVNVVSTKKGKLWPTFQALMEHSNRPCRGCLSMILQKYYAQFLISDEALPFLKYVNQYCETFDVSLLKKLCVWMCPLQDCFKIVYRALCTSQPNIHLSKMRRLIRTFFGVISTLHSRISSRTQTLTVIKDRTGDNSTGGDEASNAVGSDEDYPCVIACGHNHWGVVCNGKIKLLSSSEPSTYVDIDVQLIGKISSVACGRHHTLILSENGLYSIGNNVYGQLGLGPEIQSTDTPLLVNVEQCLNYYHGDSDGIENITYIGAGQYHSVFLTDQGNLYTWGWGIHGQLAHGSIYNEFFPRKVTTLNSKIKSVSCGSCHTAILTSEGDVYISGNGAFGQIGDSKRQKTNIPLKVDLGNVPAVMIASGYFHTLALLRNNELWTWGSSPQRLRLDARSAKRKLNATQKESQDDSAIGVPVQNPPSPTVENENHLYPTMIDTSNLRGPIVKMSAGWHHSCLIDNKGFLYAWGLNLDCQLGTGNCTELFIPTVINMPKVDCDDKRIAALSNEIEPSVGCGGDFTVFVSSQGRIFVAGNTLIQKSIGGREGEFKVLFKNTTQIIRIPTHHKTMQRNFRFLSVLEEKSYPEPTSSIGFKVPNNPIETLQSFDNPNWAIELLKHLHQFIDDDTPLFDNHLRALLSIVREDYAEALNLQLNNLFQETAAVPLYLKHDSEKLKKDSCEEIESVMDELNDMKPEILNNNVELMQNLIKNVCRKTLEGGVPDELVLKLDCLCDEKSHLNFRSKLDKDGNPDLAVHANAITQSLFNILPSNSKIWTECVDEVTTFWIEHKLNMEDLEKILAQNVSEHTFEMGTAIFCSNKDVDYQKHMSPSFNLDICNSILQSL